MLSHFMQGVNSTRKHYTKKEYFPMSNFIFSNLALEGKEIKL
jgi:hypothetical protein